METFRIPKQRATVDVVHVDGSTARVSVFLAQSAEAHDGAERLSELLEEPGDFLPAVDFSSETVQWLNRTGLALVRAAPSLDIQPDGHTIPHEEEVSVFLSNGLVVHGLVTYELPPHLSRLTDFLNDSRAFLRLIEGSQLAFINKRHITRVAAREV
jgi:hypothetical protein